MAALFTPCATFPASYSGQYFVGDLVQGIIHVVDPTPAQASVFESGLALPTDIETGPDGSLYWCSISPGLRRGYKVSYVGDANRPPLAPLRPMSPAAACR